MEKSSQIKCPNCGEPINVNDVLAHQVREEYLEKYNVSVKKLNEKNTEELKKKEQEFREQLSNQEGDFKLREHSITAKEKALANARADMEKQIIERLASEKEKQALSIKATVYEEFEMQLKSLGEENEERKVKLKQLHETAAENERLKRKMEEREQEMLLEFEKKINERLKQEEDTISKRANESAELKIKEKELKIEELANKINELQRKAEQGSMQAQGEAQEIALEEGLRSLFVFDTIEEVGKGIKGADVIQTVRNQFGQECGKILYESKRTKHFSAEWVDKLKQDGIKVKADIYVIVTEALPDDINKIGHYNGVWICTFTDFKGLAMVLRDSLIRISNAFASQSNKGEKMQMLYDYMTSQEFAQQWNAVMRGYQELKASNEAERLWFEKNRKKREKQLEMILMNAAGLIGSLQGLAGSSMPEIQLLESPGMQLEESNEENSTEDNTPKLF